MDEIKQLIWYLWLEFLLHGMGMSLCSLPSTSRQQATALENLLLLSLHNFHAYYFHKCVLIV
jgi:hypothetical protein